MPLKDQVPTYAKDKPWDEYMQNRRRKIANAFPYPWAQEMATEEFQRASKAKYGHFKLEPARLSLVYEILEFILSRPEMVACYKALGARVEDDDPWPEEEAAPLPYFNEYLEHKYGNEHLGVRRAKSTALSIGSGTFTGISDPSVLDFLLLHDNQVIDDRYRYGK